MKQAVYVIIGGGIAGVSCAEGLCFLSPDHNIIIISASPMIKKVTNVRNLTKLLSEFDIEEQSAATLSDNHPNITVLQDSVVDLDYVNNIIVLSSGETVKYERLCICTGAQPKLIGKSPFIVGIRDTDSVNDFKQRLSLSRKVVVVGNGGIATELVYETSGVDIVWVLRDNHISSTFIDAGAAEFFRPKLSRDKSTSEQTEVDANFPVYSLTRSSASGAALGPYWNTNVHLKGMLDKQDLLIEYSCEVQQLLEGDDSWPVYVVLTNGKTIGCDLIVSATGVVPNIGIFRKHQCELSDDGGLKVNWKMQTSLPNIYAAGDVCSVNWDLAPQWFQMRLWTQARQMGTYAAKAMVCDIQGVELIQDFCFELFTHVTKLFGVKVVLLGLFNGQTLDNQYEILLRVTKDFEYVKLVLKNGRLQGAILIGDTDIEEMCENLILNQLDLSPFGEELLNPDIDVDDYFD